jgi:hypothetical protein
VAGEEFDMKKIQMGAASTETESASLARRKKKIRLRNKKVLSVAKKRVLIAAGVAK